MMVISFAVCLAAFALIGIASVVSSRGTKADYYIASGQVSPWLVGLSAVATNNSGYMFIGVIGYTYATGVASLWLMTGWIAGDFLASLFVHAQLRRATERTGEVSYAGVLTRWAGFGGTPLQRLMGLVTVLFLLTYAGAQLVAGSKALHVLLDWPLWAGAVIGSVLVVCYCIAGGLRASIWTDAAQSMVMIVAMTVLLVTALQALGGPAAAWHKMQAVPGFTDTFPADLALPGIAGGVLFALSWLAAGFSVIGQPHVMVRFMALDDPQRMVATRGWYYLWFILFYAAATGVGLLSRIYLVDTVPFDAELALPTMAVELLPPVLVGLILAGIFAATLSTADSLILSCSAALSHDLVPRRMERTWMLKLVTVGITVVALGLALLNSQSVFSLVILAWSGMASAFAPMLLALCLGYRPGYRTCLLAVVAGFAMALFWRYMGWQGAVYEGLPGMATGLTVIGVGALTRRGRSSASAADRAFDQGGD